MHHRFIFVWVVIQVILRGGGSSCMISGQLSGAWAGMLCAARMWFSAPGAYSKSPSPHVHELRTYLYATGALHSQLLGRPASDGLASEQRAGLFHWHEEPCPRP